MRDGERRITQRLRPAQALLLVLACLGSGCAVVSVAGAAAGAAISITGAVVSTTVKVAGKVVEKGIDAATSDDPKPAPKK